MPWSVSDVIWWQYFQVNIYGLPLEELGSENKNEFKIADWRLLSWTINILFISNNLPSNKWKKKNKNHAYSHHRNHRDNMYMLWGFGLEDRNIFNGLHESKPIAVAPMYPIPPTLNCHSSLHIGVEVLFHVITPKRAGIVNDFLKNWTASTENNLVDFELSLDQV